MTDQPEDVNIQASVNVTDAENSEINGVSVGKIYGEVNIFSDRPARTPDWSVITAYLEAVQAKGRSIQPKDERLKPLWSQRFLVHPVGQSAGTLKPVDEAVEESFARALNMAWPRSVVILAETGVGKTPALYSLFYRATDRALETGPDGSSATGSKRADRRGGATKIILPIVAVLRDLHGDLLSLLTAGFNRFAPVPITVKEIELLLEKYDCLLLLDGLDEIPANAYLGGVETLRQFLDGHPRLQSVITCRTASYHNQLGRVEALEIDLLTEEQVRQSLGDVIYEGLPASLRQLARFRSMLEIILRFDHERNQFESKGQLVRRLVRQRSGFDPDSEISPQIDAALAEGLLEKLAFAMLREHEPFLSERRVMENIIVYLEDWREDINWRQAAGALHELGVFKHDDRRQWQFGDRTTQAYFAASAAMQNQALLPNILDEASDYSWRETLEILVGIMDNPNDLLFELADRDGLVAAHCSRLARPPLDPRLQHALLDTLINQLGQESADGRQEIALFLSQNPLANTKNALLEALRREWRSGVLLALARALLPLVGAAHTETADDRIMSEDVTDRLEAVVDLWRDHTLGPQAESPNPAMIAEWRDVIEHKLVSVATDIAQPELVRGLACIILGNIGSDYARISLLERWTIGNLPVTLGWCISEGLAHINHSDVEKAALKIAGDRRPTTTQEQELQRIWSYYIIGWVGTQKKAAGLLFRALKETKSNEKVRGYAADAIGRLQPPEGRQRLEEALNREVDAWVLRKIVQALGKAGTLESIPLLEQYLKTGRVQVRQTVRSAITSIRRRYEIV
jgi:hypothetical protein